MNIVTRKILTSDVLIRTKNITIYQRLRVLLTDSQLSSIKFILFTPLYDEEFLGAFKNGFLTTSHRNMIQDSKKYIEKYHDLLQ